MRPETTTWTRSGTEDFLVHKLRKGRHQNNDDSFDPHGFSFRTFIVQF